MTDDGARRMLSGDDGDEAMMAEDARSTLMFQLSFGADSELPDLDQCAREDAEMQRRTAQAIAAREEARQHDEAQDVDLEQAMADWRHAQQQRLQDLLAAASAEVADSTPDLLSLTGLGLSDADEAAAALGEQLGAVDDGPPRVPLSMEAVAATEAERSDAAAARQERQQRDNVRAELQARESARLAMVRDLMGGGSTASAGGAGGAHETLSRLLGGSAASAAAPSEPASAAAAGWLAPSAASKAATQPPLPLPTSAAAARTAAAWARDRGHGADGRASAAVAAPGPSPGPSLGGPGSAPPAMPPAMPPPTAARAAVRAGSAGRSRAPTLLQRRAESGGGGVDGRGSRTERGPCAPAQRVSFSGGGMGGGGMGAASASLPRCVAPHVHMYARARACMPWLAAARAATHRSRGPLARPGPPLARSPGHPL